VTTDPRIVAVLGRFSIRSTTRPGVWPFVRFMRVEILASAGADGVLVRVSTPGGAALRAFAGQVDADGVRVRGLEAHGCASELRLTADVDDDGRRVLLGDWLAAADGTGATDGGFIADGVMGAAATHAA
jgi:hypothetical protein